MRPAIIADDLTGACDSAARATLAGWRPLVLPAGMLGGTGPDSADSETELVVVSTATRNQPPERAAKAVGEIARALLSRGVFPCFKKIDSTLRGPWAAEVAALRQVIEAQVVAVAPAFPACGRIVRDGTVYADGELVGALAPALAAAGIGDALIQDAESNQELAAFVESVVQRRATVLWVGSAGLARFAFGQAPAGESVAESRPPSSALAARWFIVTGSTHAATLAQVEAARAAGRDAVGASVEVVNQVPKTLGRDTGLFLVGGDTAEGAVGALEVEALEVFGEILPGVATGRLLGGRAHGVPFLSKAGGFGQPDALIRAITLAMSSPRRQAAELIGNPRSCGFPGLASVWATLRESGPKSLPRPWPASR